MDSKPKPQRLGRLSLSPLSLEDALKAALQTGPPPEMPKKQKKVGGRRAAEKRK